MSDLTLSIFPNDAAITVTTTVWVGVMVVVFLNLRLGWTLSGLVVPGYLVPLLIAKPVSATVICVEAVLTYWIVYLVSERGLDRENHLFSELRIVLTLDQSTQDFESCLAARGAHPENGLLSQLARPKHSRELFETPVRSRARVLADDVDRFLGDVGARIFVGELLQKSDAVLDGHAAPPKHALFAGVDATGTRDSLHLLDRSVDHAIEHVKGRGSFVGLRRRVTTAVVETIDRTAPVMCAPLVDDPRHLIAAPKRSRRASGDVPCELGRRAARFDRSVD